MKLAMFVGVLCAAGSARADVYGVPLGTAPPPSTVSLYQLFPSPFDPRLHEDVDSAPDAFGGRIRFSRLLSCRQVGDGWATWSHGYVGSVYFTAGATGVTLSYEDTVGAAYLYVEPNPFGEFLISVTGSDGVSSVPLSAQVEGDAGAAGWLFYSDWTFTHLRTITVAGDVDFAVGEFGVAAIPASPGPPALLAIVAARRSRRVTG